jgi:5-oxoprolinase (ATP-hydrolysing)
MLLLTIFSDTQRRTRQPYGLEGGGSAASGRNTWIKKCRAEDGDLPEDQSTDSPEAVRDINIGGKATIWMGKGDRLKIETPGGGAWGLVDEEIEERVKELRNLHHSDNAGAWEPRGSIAERAAAQAAFGP